MIQGRGARAGILACLVAGGVAVSMAARSDVKAPDGPAQVAAGAATQAEREAIGLTFRLSDAQVIDNAPPRVPTAPAAPLDEREAQALLDAIPAVVDKEHAHTAMEHVPGFWTVFGLLGCLLLVVVAKILGRLGISTREDYYDD